MRENDKLKISFLISIIIVLGFAAIVLLNYNAYSKIIKDDIENISKLTATNIYAEIENELIKPLFVSLTMANDNFLKTWLNEEENIANKELHIRELQDYLIGIEHKYDYNSVFLISENTSYYYHYKGIHKTVSKEDYHDQWYYTFRQSNKSHELDVDTDEAASNILTVFVNCRIEDFNQNFMGVAGVGLKMNHFQGLLKQFEDTYDLEAFLINEEGTVLVHTNNELIETYNAFSNPTIYQFKNEIINCKEDLNSSSFKEDGIEGYLITKYIEELDWYLVVKKDTSVLRKSFSDQLTQELIIILIVIIFGVLLINRMLERHWRNINVISNTDQLTKLPNRRGFDQALSKKFSNNKSIEDGFNVFVFDIDDFKKINDSKGHIFGDRVICLIGTYVNDFIGNRGMIARWGGDEFAGIIDGTLEEAEIILSNLITHINNNNELNQFNITISIGLTHVGQLDTQESIIYKADQGMYKAKANGKNQMNTYIG